MSKIPTAIVTILLLGMVLLYFLSGNDEQKLHEFKLVERHPNSMEFMGRELSENEKLKLVKLFDHNGIYYVDSVGKIWFRIPMKSYEPKLFMETYTNLIFESVKYDSVR